MSIGDWYEEKPFFDEIKQITSQDKGKRASASLY